MRYYYTRPRRLYESTQHANIPVYVLYILNNQGINHKLYDFAFSVREWNRMVLHIIARLGDAVQYGDSTVLEENYLCSCIYVTANEYKKLSGASVEDAELILWPLVGAAQFYEEARGYGSVKFNMSIKEIKHFAKHNMSNIHRLSVEEAATVLKYVIEDFASNVENKKDLILDLYTDINGIKTVIYD